MVLQESRGGTRGKGIFMRMWTLAKVVYLLGVVGCIGCLVSGLFGSGMTRQHPLPLVLGQGLFVGGALLMAFLGTRPLDYEERNDQK